MRLPRTNRSFPDPQIPNTPASHGMPRTRLSPPVATSPPDIPIAPVAKSSAAPWSGQSTSGRKPCSHPARNGSRENSCRHRRRGESWTSLTNTVPHRASPPPCRAGLSVSRATPHPFSGGIPPSKPACSSPTNLPSPATFPPAFPAASARSPRSAPLPPVASLNDVGPHEPSLSSWLTVNDAHWPSCVNLQRRERAPP